MISADTELISDNAGFTTTNTGLISFSVFVCDKNDTSIATDAAVVILVRQFIELAWFGKLSVCCGRSRMSCSPKKTVSGYVEC